MRATRVEWPEASGEWRRLGPLGDRPGLGQDRGGQETSGVNMRTRGSVRTRTKTALARVSTR